jgi:CRISPR-associated protein Cas1
VVTQGATVGKSGERLTIRKPGGETEYVRLIDVAELSVFGHVQLTAAAVRALAERGVPVLHHTYGGWLIGVTTSPTQRNVLLRVAQYKAAADERTALGLARAFVSGKIRNQRTLLRRNHRTVDEAVLHELARLARAAERVRSADRLLGMEGTASRVYFSEFAGMLKTGAGFDFSMRTRRPPTDPVNALLSLLYSLLAKECVRATLAVGLDPYLGFFHRVRYGRPSLALDLTEEFRPLISDSVVITLLNNDMLDESDFVRRGPACALREKGRKKVLEMYEARMETLIRHPLFGYSMSYRRVLEVQARLLARVVEGEISEYRPFVTR